MLYIFIVLSTIFLPYIDALSHNPLAFSTHGMVILLDDQELWSAQNNLLNKPQGDTLLAITNAILQAISSESFPIILTKKSYCILRLLQLFGEYLINNNQNSLQDIEKTLDLTQPYLYAFRLSDSDKIELRQGIKELVTVTNYYRAKQSWLKVYSKTVNTVFNSQYGPLIILAAYYNFIPKNWHISEINDSLVLLMPKKIYVDDLLSGIALNSLTNIVDKPLSQIAREALMSEKDLVKGIEKVFVPHSFYGSNKSPSWTLYINGHGNNKPPLYALLTPNDLIILIKRLNASVNLKLFNLSACYLKENVTNQLNEILKNEFEKTAYSPITSILAFGGISESFSGNISMLKFSHIFSLNTYGKPLVIKTLVNDYDSFFADLSSGKPIDFESTLNKVFVFKSNNNIYPFNIPMIRFTSNEVLTPLQAPTLIASIGSTLARTRDSNETLYVNSFFKQSKSDCPSLPKILSLYTPFVPFFLEIKKCGNDTFPIILTMINEPITALKGLIVEGFTALNGLKKLFEFEERNKVYLYHEIIEQKISDKDPSQKKILNRYSEVVVIKSAGIIQGYKPGIYYRNQQGEMVQHIFSRGTWQTAVTPREPFKDFYSLIQSSDAAFAQSSTIMQEIQGSLNKKRRKILESLFNEFFTDQQIISQLL